MGLAACKVPINSDLTAATTELELCCESFHDQVNMKAFEALPKVQREQYYDNQMALEKELAQKIRATCQMMRTSQLKWGAVIDSNTP